MIKHSINLEPIQRLLEQIKDTYHPQQVWLFGSRARQQARQDSDWDLLVIVPDATDDALFDPLVAWKLRKLSGVYADVIPCRNSDFQDSVNIVNTLSYEVAKDGVLVYEH